MPSRKYAPFFYFYRAFPHAARMLHISELSVRTAKPQIDDLVVLLELLPALGLSRQVGKLLTESDVLVDEILPLIIYRTVNSKMTRSPRPSTASRGRCSSRGFIWHKNGCACPDRTAHPIFALLKRQPPAMPVDIKSSTYG